MKAIILAALVLLLLTMLHIPTSILISHAEGDPDITFAADKMILDSTVQILLFASDTPYQFERGLGTLVEHKGQALILSHNHWLSMFSLDKVQFRDSANNLILELDKQGFRRLIIYQDLGSMILWSPFQKEASASFSKFQEIQVNDRLQVPIRKPGDRNRLMVATAEVQSFDRYEGLPVFEIEMAKGTKLAPGDSGGGIWVNGALAGNIWARLPAAWYDITSGPVGSTGYAAQLPDHFLGTAEFFPERSSILIP